MSGDWSAFNSRLDRARVDPHDFPVRFAHQANEGLEQPFPRGGRLQAFGLSESGHASP